MTLPSFRLLVEVDGEKTGLGNKPVRLLHVRPQEVLGSNESKASGLPIKFSLAEEDGHASESLHQGADLAGIPLDEEVCGSDGVDELLRLDGRSVGEKLAANPLLIPVEEAVALLLLGKGAVKKLEELIRVVGSLAVFVLVAMIPGPEFIVVLGFLLVEGFLDRRRTG